MEAGFLALVALSVLKGLSLLLSYITNNAFPQPLSEEEEQKYLELWQQGDQQARNVLIEHNLRLVAHITKKFENTGEDNDDLISIGTLGLIKAINTYNKDKGTKLATYAARCIENDNSITKTSMVTHKQIAPGSHAGRELKHPGSIGVRTPVFFFYAGGIKVAQQQRYAQLLLDEPPLVVLPSLAVKYGLEEAVFLQQLHYWLQRSDNIVEGKYWVFNSVPKWREQMPFMSETKLKRIIKRLENMGLIETRQMNKSSMDHTKWYTINYEKLYEVPADDECEINGDKGGHDDGGDQGNNAGILSTALRTGQNDQIDGAPRSGQNDLIDDAASRLGQNDPIDQVVLFAAEPSKPCAPRVSGPYRDYYTETTNVVVVGEISGKIQAAFAATTGHPLPAEAASELARYPLDYVSAKIALLDQGKEKRNAVGWLLEACREDYRHLPGPVKPKKKRPSPGPPLQSSEHDKYRELYRLV